MSRIVDIPDMDDIIHVEPSDSPGCFEVRLYDVDGREEMILVTTANESQAAIYARQAQRLMLSWFTAEGGRFTRK